MPTAIVTGCAGFIGGHLCERLLEDGWEVVGIDDMSRGTYSNIPKGVKHYHKPIENLCCSDIQEFSGCDVVFHLAAWARVQQSFEDPDTYFTKNVRSTQKLLELCRGRVGRVIFASSSSVYGDQKMPAEGLNESLSLNPISPYASQKMIGEVLMRQYAQCHDLPTLSVRFFNVYGKRMASGDAYMTVIQKFLEQKKMGKPFTVWGNGFQTRDFTHVDDVVDGLILAAELRGSNWGCVFDGRAINLGGGEPKSVLDIAKLIDPTWPKEFGEGQKEPHQTKSDYRVALSNIGWSSKRHIEDKITELL